MVEVVQARVADRTTAPYNNIACPRVEIHHIRREVHGNSVAVVVYGEISMASTEVLFAHDLKLQTLQVLTLTVDSISPAHRWMAKKWVFNKGEYGNYASIDIFNDAGTAITAGNGDNVDGSVWLNFVAVGE